MFPRITQRITQNTMYNTIIKCPKFVCSVWLLSTVQRKCFCIPIYKIEITNVWVGMTGEWWKIKNNTKNNKINILNGFSLRMTFQWNNKDFLSIWKKREKFDGKSWKNKNHIESNNFKSQIHHTQIKCEIFNRKTMT